MTLLDRIKSLLGLDSSRSTASNRDVDVATETRSTTDSSTGSSTDASTAPATDRSSGATTETASADPSATADTGEEPPEEWGVPAGFDGDPSEADGDATTSAAETADRDDSTDLDAGAAGDDEPSVEDAIEEAEPEAESTAADAGEQTSEALTDVKGIGPAYEQRLQAAGVESVAALIEADPEALADATDLSSTRIERWQERADALRAA